MYISAIEHDQNGERTISIDEMTGIQATRVRVAMEQECTLRLQALSRERSSYRIRQSLLDHAEGEVHPVSNAQLKQTDNVPTY